VTVFCWNWEICDYTNCIVMGAALCSTNKDNVCTTFSNSCILDVFHVYNNDNEDDDDKVLK